MEKILLIYNPVSGEGEFSKKIDTFLKIFQKNNWFVSTYRTQLNIPLDPVIKIAKEENYDKVIVAGGDGTIHNVVNSLKKENFDVPVGIIPAGTANDLAYQINMPSDLEKSCETLLDSVTCEMDLGIINEKYFVNVASAGILIDVPHETSIKFKQIAGKFAYYLKGLEKIPSLRPVPMEIKWEGGVINEEVLLFLVLNGSTAGGFTTLAPDSKINDGFFDVLVFKGCTFAELATLFIRLLRGEHFKSDKLIYFRTAKYLEINCAEEVPTDIDGEPGPDFPLKISIVKNAQKILIPKSYWRDYFA